MPMPGDAVYVAVNGSLREYALFLFDEAVSENMMRITNVSTVRLFCIVLHLLFVVRLFVTLCWLCMQDEQEEIRLSSPRIWRGSTAQGIFIESGDSFFPMFHRIAVDLSKREEIKRFLESRKRKSISTVESPEETVRPEATRNTRTESTAQPGMRTSEDRVESSEDEEENDSSMENDQEAPSDSKEMQEDTVRGKDGKKSAMRASARDSKEARVRKSAKLKEIRKSPMSDDGAAEVLSGLANLGSEKATVPTTHKCVNPIKSWRALQVTDATRTLTTGDRIEIWANATKKSPGGWVGGTVCDLSILNSGESAPYFAFILARLDSLRVAFDGECYLEWRPLAVKVPSSDAPAYQMQVRIPSSQPRGDSFMKGDRVEALVDDVWCPGTITAIGEHLCNITFDCPALDKDNIRGNHCLTFVRRAHGLEEHFYGMLKEFPTNS